jgi:hypothetical protein
MGSMAQNEPALVAGGNPKKIGTTPKYMGCGTKLRTGLHQLLSGLHFMDDPRRIFVTFQDLDNPQNGSNNASSSNNIPNFGKGICLTHDIVHNPAAW